MVTITEDEWQAIQAEMHELRTQVVQLSTALAIAQQRIEELEGQKTPPPPFVKANKPEKPKAVRKKRAPEHNHARRRSATPIQVVDHPITECPECHGHLSSVQVGRTRQVIEIAPPPPVEVIEHQIQRGWCSYGRKWREASLDLHDQVVGQGRIGVRLAATITTMRMALRLPIRLIQHWLATMHQMPLSLGAITDLLQRTAHHLKPVAEQIRNRVRGSPAVNADETGWREDGRNGYIWGMGTPEGDWYFERHASRSGKIIDDLLGEDFTGVLTTDFYAGYNDTPGGKHQRCWVHLLRDLHKLKELHPNREDVRAWAMAVRQVYDEAVAIRPHAEAVRRTQREHGERQIRELGQQYGGEKGHPCQTLAKRLLRYQGELLVFLTAPGVEPDNNHAERMVRPLVVTRKISGGSRSKVGSDTHMILASVVQTCQAKANNVYHEILRLLQSPLPQL